MAALTPSVRRIGLSLGADLCWPTAFEDIVKQLDLAIPWEGEEVRFEVDRVTVEPFDLRYTPKYDVVLDRLTHWFHTSREWIKKITLMDGVYVLNNPWAIQSMEKHSTYCAMMKLGMKIPDTWLLPPKEYDQTGDIPITVQRYNKLFDLSRVGEQVGYPCFLKPYDGGGWVGVIKCDNAKELHAAYDRSGKRVHHLQAAVKDWDLFVRGIGVGPQVMMAKYDPDAPLHARYVVDYNFLDAKGWQKATRITRVINAFFRWDFNSCEMLRAGETLHPIDFANACPDSQVTSLHYYFPNLVKALLRWTLFCATVKRKPALNLEWKPFLEISELDIPWEEKLERYDALALEYYDADRFWAFCNEHLAQLDQIAVEYFASERFREVARQKVAALFPPHEVEMFTDHFIGLVRFWCKTESERIAKGAKPVDAAAPAGEEA